MKIKGFTITEISINMLISGIIIIFIISFLAFQNRILSIQIRDYNQISEIRLIQSIISNNIHKHHLITGNQNEICFQNITTECHQSISFYTDSIIIHQPKKLTFQLKNHTTISFLQDSIVSNIKIVLYINDQEHQILYQKSYSEGELLNIESK